MNGIFKMKSYFRRYRTSYHSMKNVLVNTQQALKFYAHHPPSLIRTFRTYYVFKEDCSNDDSIDWKTGKRI